MNEAAARVRGLWLGFVALLAYLFIAVGAVTHRDLLLENPVKLPVLNVELPLIGFFGVAPVFLLINHFYVLLQLLGLGQRIREFNNAIAETDLGDDARRRERRKLDTFVMVQWLGGTKEEGEQLTGKFLGAIALVTIVIAPVLLSLLIQLQFLSYQSEAITWWHRIVLGIDLALLWALWPSIKIGEWTFRSPIEAGSWRERRGMLVRTAGALLIMIFACGIAAFPGEYIDGGAKYQLINRDGERVEGIDWRKPSDSNLSSLKGWLFGNLHFGFERTEGLFFLARALDLPDNKTFIDLDKFDKIRKRNEDNEDQFKRWEIDRTRSLRTRNLRGARFDRSDLRNVDLFKAKLQGASLLATNLEGASLRSASLQGATLERAKLQGAQLHRASLEGVVLNQARLQGASLDAARLQGASLNFVDLQNASLLSASLQKASFWYSNLQGASLEGADLQGASLRLAELQGASLVGANMQGASLETARLQGASLVGAQLQGALLVDANLQGASLAGANLEGASLRGAKLNGASLAGANLQGASLIGAALWRAYGIPFVGDPVSVWVSEPQLNALTADKVAELEKNALNGVKNENVKRRIKAGLAFLSHDNGLVNTLPQNYWTGLTGMITKADHQEGLAERLVVLACKDKGAPYVAQGLILPGPQTNSSSRFTALGLLGLARVTRTLLDAVEGRTADCPGAKKLDRASIVRLRSMAAEVGNKTKQTEE